MHIYIYTYIYIYLSAYLPSSDIQTIANENLKIAYKTENILAGTNQIKNIFKHFDFDRTIDTFLHEWPRWSAINFFNLLGCNASIFTYEVEALSRMTSADVPLFFQFLLLHLLHHKHY